MLDLGFSEDSTYSLVGPVMLGSGYVWQQNPGWEKELAMFSNKIRSWEKERRRSTWEREKREGKGAPERQRNKWVLGISGLVSEGKVVRFDLFSGARLSFYLGLWSKLIWLFFGQMSVIYWVWNTKLEVELVFRKHYTLSRIVDF